MQNQTNNRSQFKRLQANENSFARASDKNCAPCRMNALRMCNLVYGIWFLLPLPRLMIKIRVPFNDARPPKMS